MLGNIISSITKTKASSPTSLLINLATKRFSHEYAPRYQKIRKAHKGRVPVRTGGSIKGSTLQLGNFGLRLKSEGVRLTSKQLKEADNAIMRVVRGSGAKLYKRFVASVAVCIKGNETRMGKGKGPFDHWAVRVPTGKILFEIEQGPTLHEKLIRDTFRKAGDKLPGIYEVVTELQLPRVGLNAVTEIPEKINVVEQKLSNPSKQQQNILKGKEEQYRLYKNY